MEAKLGEREIDIAEVCVSRHFGGETDCETQNLTLRLTQSEIGQFQTRFQETIAANIRECPDEYEDDPNKTFPTAGFFEKPELFQSHLDHEFAFDSSLAFECVESLLPIAHRAADTFPFVHLQRLRSAGSRGGYVELVFDSLVLDEITPDSPIPDRFNMAMDYLAISSFSVDCVNMIINDWIGIAKERNIKVSEFADTDESIKLRNELIRYHFQTFFGVKLRRSNKEAG